MRGIFFPLHPPVLKKRGCPPAAPVPWHTAHRGGRRPWPATIWLRASTCIGIAVLAVAALRPRHKAHVAPLAIVAWIVGTIDAVQDVRLTPRDQALAHAGHCVVLLACMRGRGGVSRPGVAVAAVALALALAVYDRLGAWPYHIQRPHATALVAAVLTTRWLLAPSGGATKE